MDAITKHRKQKLADLVASPRFGGSQSELAREAGMSKGRISQLLDEGMAFGERSAKSLAERLDLPPRYFDLGFIDDALLASFGGRRVVALDADDPLPEGVVLIKESRVRFSAGDGHIVPRYEEIEESLPATYRRSWFREQRMNPAKVLRFQVKGRSMETTLFDGDSVLVNLAENEVKDQKVYALRYGEELRIKRLFRRLDGSLVLHSDNADFQPEIVAPHVVEEHITIIGRVREKAGNGGLD